MFRSHTVPEDDRLRFEQLRKDGVSLERDTPLMPVFEPRSWRHGLRVMKTIKTLPAGTDIDFLDIRMKGARPWYRVAMRGSRVTGWINSLMLEGKGVA